MAPLAPVITMTMTRLLWLGPGGTVYGVRGSVSGGIRRVVRPTVYRKPYTGNRSTSAPCQHAMGWSEELFHGEPIGA
jgi:hypothetical protein